MSADNNIYDVLAATWWAKGGFLNSMGTLLNPARVPNLFPILNQASRSKRGLISVLDVGSGGGLLAEEIARPGISITGADISRKSVGAAKMHARDLGMNITYLVADGRHLPFEDASFDAVICSDILEHVEQWRRVIRESSRALRPSGILFFETVNRTPLSWFVAIKMLQHWLRVLPTDLHVYRQFIRPDEIRNELSRNGVEVRQITGVWPASTPPAALATMVQLKLGRIDFGEAAARLKMRRGSFTALSYMGFGVRSR